MKRYIFWIAICLGIGALGGLLTAEGVRDWYPGLVKPPLTPPNWVFGPVWTILYIMIGASFALYQTKGPHPTKLPAIVFVLHLVVNLFWSFAFFFLTNPSLALGTIIILLLLISLLIYKFISVSKWAAYLLVPYALWVSFATYLNAAILYLN